MIKCAQARYESRQKIKGDVTISVFLPAINFFATEATADVVQDTLYSRVSDFLWDWTIV